MADVDRLVATQFGAGVEELIVQLQRLGLQWTLRNATVVAYGADAVDATNVQGVYDGDVATIRMISLVGAPPVGARVAVVFVPPAGNYIIGFLNRVIGSNEVGIAGFFTTTDFTSSATFVNLTGTSSVEITKQHNDTRLRVELHATFFSANANTGVEFGVLVAGTDYVIAPYHAVLPAASTRLNASGVLHVTGVASGGQVVQGRWRRTQTVANLNRNADDWLALIVSEIN